ncbi:succinylglutamate desuccinylase [Halomonas marinisediminis]|uniref:Succinylglutamate desuccinylase n=1 Tax=Halomonas marinisediminis TaxID=2546095 RepID=A0ABY2D4N6_9GAMM|nr:succinylglutamate desuccinylase [Halomonas marinisediminis]TDB01436.1 succinylglutamate desuccinylase [Halomonas marinisediminis]
MLETWLKQSIDEADFPTHGELCGGQFRRLGHGLLELLPDSPAPSAHACVISAGIHGNETAPMELLDDLLKRLAAGKLRLGAPLLVILGSPPATREQTRYINTNLNRLFRRDLGEQGMEPERARELMAAVDAFYTRHADRPRLHYDLHTAIRGSRYPRFVVNPWSETTAVAPEQWRWLAGADIQAVLHQHCHSWTFSHYSKHYHDAQAFTLELGHALPFGHNDLTPLAPMARLLQALLEDHEPNAAPPERMVFYRVEQELIRHSEAFRLAFADDTPNFTEFAPGTLLAEDASQGETRVGTSPLSVVFPNAAVEVGARAALLATPTPPPE